MLNKKIILFCIIAAFCSCVTIKAPEGYVPRGKEAEKYVYGSWISVFFQEENKESNKFYAEGELLAIQHDTVYILYLTSLKTIPVGDISKAVIVTNKFRGAQPFLWGAAAFIPNLIGILAYTEYSGGFLVLGITHIISAGIATTINYFSANEISYPMQIPYINRLNIYARFPQGIPPGIDPYKLTSKPF